MQFGLIYVFLKQDAGVPGWHPVLFAFGNTFTAAVLAKWMLWMEAKNDAHLPSVSDGTSMRRLEPASSCVTRTRSNPIVNGC